MALNKIHMLTILVQKSLDLPPCVFNSLLSVFINMPNDFGLTRAKTKLAHPHFTLLSSLPILFNDVTIHPVAHSLIRGSILYSSLFLILHI